MAPSRRKGSSKTTASASARRQWKVGDLVLAKVKGFPAWPATVSEPGKWGYSADWKKVLVYFFGTQQIAFCNHADVEAFTEEKKQTLMNKRHGKGADFMRAVQEIIDCYEKMKMQEQANDLNSGTEAAPAIVGNSLASSTNLQLQEICKDPAEASYSPAKCSPVKVKAHFNEGSVLMEEAKDVLLVTSLLVKPEVEKHVTGGTVEDPPILCTYSLRKKSGTSHLESITTRRRAPSLRRSRSSLRGESSRTGNLMMPTKDAENAVGVSSNLVHDSSLRRGGRIQKTSDVSKENDMGSLDSVQNGSTDDNGSEIISTCSDMVYLKEDSAADYCFKRENEVAIVECVVGDVDPKKGLDMHINAIYVKKKRKPNRKRVTHEAADLNMVTGATLEVVKRTKPNLLNVTTENCFKDDGDEHLPLLKRARVRMSKQESVEEGHNTLHLKDKYRVEDKHPGENPVEDRSPVEVINDSNTPDDTHLNWDVTKEYLDDVDQCMMQDASDGHDLGPSSRKEAPCGVPLSEDCAESFCTRSCLWKVNKTQLAVSSAHGEAALPPSKRLHRAFEAMSANAVQDCAYDGASTTNELPSLDCSLSRKVSPVEAMVSVAGNELEKQISDSIVNQFSSKSASSTHLNVIEIEESEIMEEMDICQKPTNQPNNLAYFQDVGRVDKQGGPSSSAFHVTSDLKMNNISRSLSPVCEASELSLKFNQVSIVSGECFSESPGKKCASVTEEIIPERHDTSEETPCFQHEMKNAGDSPICEQQAHQQTLESDCEVVHLKPQHGDISETSSSMSKLKKKRDVQLESDGTFKSCGNCDSYSKDISSTSPSSTDRTHTPAHVSPINASYCQQSTSSSDMVTQNNGSCSPLMNSHCKKPTSDSADGVITQNNGSCSPVTNFHHKKPRHDMIDGDGNLESLSPKPKPLRNFNIYSEAQSALSSFESILGVLTRTKESIGRATRIAIDCAKFGFGTKAVERLARSLEEESSLSRRVDLFFLVDSILQSSRGLKGDVGGASYPPIIQHSLPRLISAAAPPGSAAHENRRQCLKVLRLWMERKAFPDSILRHHMREIDNHNVSSSNGAYSRRSARTERAFDDPVREMEGMLVDEYGSNSSFQLPGFCMPRMLKDVDDGSDSDGSFEAVTPERSPETPQQDTTSPVGKHRHILQDVDGELEMEDVAPTEAEICSLNNIVSSSEILQTAGQQRFPLPMAPPALPDQPSTSSMPVSSLVPPPPTHPRPAHHVASTSLEAHVNGIDQNSHDNRSNLGRSKQVQTSDSTSSSMHSRRSMENGQHSDGSRYSSKPHPDRPPYGAPSNQHSYGEHRGRPHRDCPPHREGPPPYSSRYSHNRFNGNYYNHHDRMKPPPYEVRENWRFSEGPRYPEKSRSSSCSGPPYDYDCPPCEPPRFPNHGWSHPPRPIVHRNHMPFKPHYEGDGYWPPR